VAAPDRHVAFHGGHVCSVRREAHVEVAVHAPLLGRCGRDERGQTQCRAERAARGGAYLHAHGRYSEPNTFLMSELACPMGSLRISCSSSAMRLNSPSSALAVT